MSLIQQKDTVRSFLDEVLNQRDLAATDRYVTEECADHLKGSLTFYLVLSAFPDFRLNIEHVIAEGENVAVLSTFSGTHKQVFMGIPPSGQGVTGRVAFSFRVIKDKIVESWAEFEPWGLLQQVGVSPMPNAIQ